MRTTTYVVELNVSIGGVDNLWDKVTTAPTLAKALRLAQETAHEYPHRGVRVVKRVVDATVVEMLAVKGGTKT